MTVKEDGFCCLFPVEHEIAEINTTCTADIEVACTAGMVTVADFHYANRLMTITMTIHHVDVKVTIYIYFVAIGFIKK